MSDVYIEVKARAKDVEGVIGELEFVIEQLRVGVLAGHNEDEEGGHRYAAQEGPLPPSKED